MKAGYSIWISNEKGHRIFGLGPYQLLKCIEEQGSLNKAAKDMGISYTKAFNILKRAEEELNMTLIERVVGGVHGGGSKVTSDGEKLLEKFESYRTQCVDSIEKIYKEVFSDL